MPDSTSTVILIPVFNDWAAARLLLQDTDQVLAAEGLEARILFVDDGSTEPPDSVLAGMSPKALGSIDVLALKRNLGHQRAIAIGLAFAAEKIECDSLVIMDGDGEDAPRDIPRLLARLGEEGGSAIVFAERARRTEGIVFRTCYQAYKVLHLALTGVAVRVGNFSAVPGKMLGKLAVLSELWNHYSAAVFVSRLPFKTIPTARAARLDGRSKMNFQDLVVHGLRALSVFGETITVRLLILAALVFGVLGVSAIVVVARGCCAEASVPGGTLAMAGAFILALLHGFVITALIAFVMIGRRSYSHFLPCRDYGHFVDSCRRLFGSGQPPECTGNDKE